MATLRTPHPQEAVRKDAAFEKRLELVFDKLRQARRTSGARTRRIAQQWDHALARLKALVEE